jgi:hypothetical protein
MDQVTVDLMLMGETVEVQQEAALICLTLPMFTVLGF